MRLKEIRTKFLDFFRKNGHEIVPSSPLIPVGDPTLLFTNAGMVQFKKVFLGEETRPYKRAASVQKCMRAGGKHNDLENVGYTARHHTFFEMLGNFSFGDYFKKEAIIWAWDLLITEYKLPQDRLYASVYLEDDEAYEIWEKEVGLPAERIVRLGEKDNFWTMGDTGPCGPCSEIIIDQGPELGCGRPDCGPGCDCDRYLEIWNLVFTQYNRDASGRLTPLPRPNIDTGMGLERLTAVVQGVKSNYEIDLFKDIISRIEDISGQSYGIDKKKDVAFRVIADHARAISFLIADGVIPSNEGRGYVLRRIIRRAARFGSVLGIKKIGFLSDICMKVIEVMGEDYRELIQAKNSIIQITENEEKRFAQTLSYSMRILEEEIEKIKSKKQDTIPGELIFKLYDTYGLPVDILEDIARYEGLKLDMEGYKKAMQRQRELSQKSWKSDKELTSKGIKQLMEKGQKTEFLGYELLKCKAKVVGIIKDGDGRLCERIAQSDRAELVLDKTPFYGESGGQVGDTGYIRGKNFLFKVEDTKKPSQDLILHIGILESGYLCVGDEVEAEVDKERREDIARNHTSTHLLHATLRELLGVHVKQAGSLVAPDRLRFDFSHFSQIPWDKIEEIEAHVNRLIRENHPVNIKEMHRDEAIKSGAVAIFEEKYGEIVRVVEIGDGVSKELCGGTHVKRTGDIGFFKIIGESSVASNVRRIEAITGGTAVRYVQEKIRQIRDASFILKVSAEELIPRIERLLEEIKEKDKQIESLKQRLLTGKAEDITAGIKEINGIKVVAKVLEADSQKELRDAADKIRDKIRSGVVMVGAEKDGKVMLICMVTKDLTSKFNAGKIIKEVASFVGGKGGGRPDMAQGGGSKPEHLKTALEHVYEIINRHSS